MDQIFVYPWREYAGNVERYRRRNANRTVAFRAKDAMGEVIGTYPTWGQAKTAVVDEWHRAHGNPRLIVTEDGTGRTIVRGDTVTSFRGEIGTFDCVSARGCTGTWKVTVDGREYYHTVWNVTVTEERDGERNCPQCGERVPPRVIHRLDAHGNCHPMAEATPR